MNAERVLALLLALSGALNVVCFFWASFETSFETRNASHRASPGGVS